MGFSKGRASVTFEELSEQVSQFELAKFYLGIKNIPSLFNSPLRKDKHPSFGIYSPDGINVRFKDFSTGENGSIFELLQRIWGCNFSEMVLKILEDSGTRNLLTSKGRRKYKFSETQLQVRVRPWEDYDIAYWESYGISKKWLKYAEVYPISHKIVIKDQKQYVFKADKYAYVYVEHKEGNTTYKIYQPFNKNGFKWSNKHDSSVISLWTKVPKKGEKLCICSSLKDALCLWANTGIPSVAVQGEGYTMSTTAIKQLKERFKFIFILFDNDEAGLEDGRKLAGSTGFINVVLPKFEGGKDVSDYYKVTNNKETFKHNIVKLFNTN